MKNSSFKKLMFILAIIMITGIVFNGSISYADGIALPNIDITVETADSNQEIADTLQILIVLTILTLAPSILMMMTSFTRIIIVFSFVRRSLSLQGTPPNQVLIGLALFLTFFIMAPVFAEVYEEAYIPFANDELALEEAYEKAIDPMRDYMFRQVRSKDLALFVEISGVENLDEFDDIADAIPTTSLIPAFIISEIKTGFEIGFLLFIPFIVIDMIVASTLMALGMMMLPPVMISLPFKILLFIMVDGWNLIIENIIKGIR